MNTATDTYYFRFEITDRDMAVNEIKRVARGEVWHNIAGTGCLPAGGSQVNIDHETGTITVAVPVIAPAHLPRNTPTKI